MSLFKGMMCLFTEIMSLLGLAVFADCTCCLYQNKCIGIMSLQRTMLSYFTCILPLEKD